MMKKNYIAPEFEELLIASSNDILASFDQSQDDSTEEPPNIEEDLTPSGGSIKDNPMIG